MGAHIIKVKPPKAGIDLDAAKAAYEKAEVPMETLAERIAHVMQACFAGQRLVVFSGGEAKGTEGLLDEIRADPRRRRQRLDHRPQHASSARRRRRSSSWTKSLKIYLGQA